MCLLVKGDAGRKQAGPSQKPAYFLLRCTASRWNRGRGWHLPGPVITGTLRSTLLNSAPAPRSSPTSARTADRLVFHKDWASTPVPRQCQRWTHRLLKTPAVLNSTALEPHFCLWTCLSFAFWSFPLLTKLSPLCPPLISPFHKIVHKFLIASKEKI